MTELYEIVNIKTYIMKKARLLLLIICIMSLAGGLFAAKINNRISFWIYIRANTGTTRCTVWIHGFWSIPAVLGQPPVSTTYFTTNNNGTCTVLLPYYTAA
jgi:hypothetical protein